MAKYRIPENFIAAYDLINELSDDAVSILSKELEKVKVGANTDEISSLLKEPLKKDLPISELQVIVEAVFSIYSLINRDKQNNLDDILGDLVESFIETKEGNDYNSEKLKINLHKLIKRGSHLDLTHKTFDLLSEYDKIYIDSRVISDIRIIFGNDIKETEQEAAIVHQLRIEYHEKGDIKNLFFALDSNDLENLKINIERAQEKDQLIRNKTYKNMSFILLKR